MGAKSPSDLREIVRGEVIVQGDAEYETVRSVHNGMIDKRPAVVVRVMNAGDLIATVNYAREDEAQAAVRSPEPVQGEPEYRAITATGRAACSTACP